MRRALAAIAVVGTVSFLPAVALAQEEATPTTLDVQTSTVEREVTVQTVTSSEVDDDDNDDDSDKTGLWGLLGLLGLAGLAGLKRRNEPEPYRTATPPTGGAAPKRPDGATSH